MCKHKNLKTLGISILLILALTACNKGTKNNVQSPNQNNTVTKAPQTATQTPQTANQAPQAATQVPQEPISYLYTANESGSVSKIDLSTNKVVETIKDEGTPHNVQVSPDGKVVAYTSPVKMEDGQEDNDNMGTMAKKGSAVFYDTEAGNLIKMVEVGNHPAHIVFTQDGKYVLVTNNADNNVSIIDATTYDLIINVSVGKGPHGFRISSDSKFAYIANNDEDTISVVDIDNQKEVRKITVGKNPVTTGITKDGKTLVATVNSENSVAVIDLSTDNVKKIEVGIGPAQLYIDSDDKYVYVANQGTEEQPSNSVTKIDLNTVQVAATIQTGNGTHGVIVSPDGRYTYVTNMYDATVSVIDNTSNSVTATIPVDKEPNGISLLQR